jgi:hypothetical protein
VGQFEMWRDLTDYPTSQFRVIELLRRLKRLRRKAAVVLLRLLKPSAVHNLLTARSALTRDRHKRAPGLQLNGVPYIERHISLSEENESAILPKRNLFGVNHLELVKGWDSFRDPREPEFRIGDRVQLNSGGPSSLVVDIDTETVTIAWNGAEAVFPRPCVHRVRD